MMMQIYGQTNDISLVHFLGGLFDLKGEVPRFPLYVTVEVI